MKALPPTVASLPGTHNLISSTVETQVDSAALPKIRRPCQLKREHQRLHPESDFFSPEAMRCYGDTMANFGLRQPREISIEGVKCHAYELVRHKPVRNGLSRSNWFHATTLAVLGRTDEENQKTP